MTYQLSMNNPVTHETITETISTMRVVDMIANDFAAKGWNVCVSLYNGSNFIDNVYTIVGGRVGCERWN